MHTPDTNLPAPESELPAITTATIPPVVRECERLRAMLTAACDQHNDLIMQVSRRFEGETRHDTAKRYIREAEERCCSGPAVAAHDDIVPLRLENVSHLGALASITNKWNTRAEACSDHTALAFEMAQIARDELRKEPPP